MSDALALEYEGDYGTARGDLDVLDFGNDPGANGVCHVLGLSFSEEWRDLISGKAASFFADAADPLLIRHYAIEPFSQDLFLEPTLPVIAEPDAMEHER